MESWCNKKKAFREGRRRERNAGEKREERKRHASERSGPGNVGSDMVRSFLGNFKTCLPKSFLFLTCGASGVTVWVSVVECRSLGATSSPTLAC